MKTYRKIENTFLKFLNPKIYDIPKHNIYLEDEDFEKLLVGL